MLHKLPLFLVHFVTYTLAGAGNTWVIPGSMETDLVDGVSFQAASDTRDGYGQPPGAIPVLAPENSCMIFDRRLLHAQSPNWSQAERLVIFMGYGARWMKARDAMYVEPAMGLTKCPIARQILGYTTQNSGLYHGNGLDVPLRTWLRSHDCNNGLGFQLALADNDGRGTGHSPTSALDGEVGHATLPRNPERLGWPLGEIDMDAWRHARDVRLGLESPRETPSLSAAEVAANDAQIFADTGIDDSPIDPEMYAANRLTPAQRKQFDEQGYLVVEDALPLPLFEECKRTLLQMAADEVARGAHAATGTDRGGFAAVTAATFSQANDLQLSALTRLLTTEKILPKVIDIMGTNTTCYHFHCNVTSSMGGTVLDEGDDSDNGAPDHPPFDQHECFGFHQDSGLQADCEYRPAPRFSMKAGFFFTDVPLGAANTWICPGKHLIDGELDRPNGGQAGQPEGAIPIVCKANSVLLFDRRLWHAATPNWGSRTRVACFVGYSWRWLRPKEPMFVEKALARSTCPIERQMLGYTTSCGGNYGPNAEDTPIVAWLKRHQVGSWSDVPLLPGWRTQRELQGQGHSEGDVGHTTASRPGQPTVVLAGRFRAPKM